MSVNGINHSAPLVSPAAVGRTDVNRNAPRDQAGMARSADGRVRSESVSTLKSQQPLTGAAAPTQAAVPPEAPAGTDPTLWSVLTTEERNFFAKTAALGPLTYSRIKAASTSNTAPPSRGVRLDVRV